MLRFLTLSALLFSTVSACGYGYQPWYDGRCITTVGKFGTFSVSYDTCEKLGAQLLSIHNEQDNYQIFNAQLVDKFETNNFFLGLQCDGLTFSWTDGSPVDYTNFEDDYQCNSDSIQYYYYMNFEGKWSRIGKLTQVELIVCIAPNLSSSHCDDFTDIPSNHDLCYQYYDEMKSWGDAEAICRTMASSGHLPSVHDKTTNDFFRRVAISHGNTGGLPIGLVTQDKGDHYNWTDGTALDYTNFASGYPDYRKGTSMRLDTTSTAGSWLNEPYEEAHPFICVKPAYIPPTNPVASPDCPTEPFTVDSEIYSPSFPTLNVTGECEYVLKASPGFSRIHLQVLFLEANVCCDSLNVFDGASEKVKIGSFTGFYSNPEVIDFYSLSPTMTIHWNATSMANTRGFHVKFTSVNHAN